MSKRLADAFYFRLAMPTTMLVRAFGTSRMKPLRIFVLAGALASPAAWASANQDPTPVKDLGSLGLEELMKVQVTTASKEAQNLSQVPAAIYVITADQIRRSTATSIPELLRVVPGVQVAQIAPSQWSVSIRGMGGRFSNKLLVLMDGRTVYSPTFSGVYWDAQDINLSLIERIEVIRGPGGSLWGTNAVNGIINIITKTAAKTGGTTVSVRSSTTSPYQLSVTHGGEIKNGAFRVDAQAFKQSSVDTISGTDGHNDWSDLSGGFRTDWTTGENAFSFSGHANSSHQGSQFGFPTLTAPYINISDQRFTTSEYSMIGKWEKTAGTNKGGSLQLSFDHYDRMMPEAQDRRTTFTADAQRPFTISPQNHMIVGAGYQISELHAISSDYVSITPEKKTTELYSALIHDEQDLGRNAKFSIGTKLEHNDFTGWEYQPSARLTYSPNDKQTFWGALSRAVRTPATSEENTNVFLAASPTMLGVPAKIVLAGNPDFDSEIVEAGELGWRASTSKSNFVDVATFYNHYTNLRGGTITGTTFESSPFPYVLETIQQTNSYSAVTAGVELATHYEATRNWHLDGSYAYYTESYHLSSSGGGALGAGAAGDNYAPRHQFSVQSKLDLGNKWEFDLASYFVGALEGQPVIPAYARLDLRLGWKPSAKTEFSFGVTNLTNTTHAETTDSLFVETARLRRSAYVKVDFHF